MATYKPFNFVSFDGADEHGVRAEVHVQVNKGTVKEVVENVEKGVANVKFVMPNLKFPIQGWIGIDTDAYREVLRAKETNEEVSFRMESQRKANVDRTTPIDELRKDTTLARENTKNLLVSVNDINSPEMLTNPNEDPTGTSGRYPAGTGEASSKSAPSNTNSTPAGISSTVALERLTEASVSPLINQGTLDHLAAQAIFNGASVEEVSAILNKNPKHDGSESIDPPKVSFSFEAQPWKEYNSDGRLNLGNNIIAGTVGAESLIYKQISTIEGGVDAENVIDTMGYFGELIFAITDLIQASSYGHGSRPDRSAMSHVRIRGIVYDVIERKAGLPLKLENNNLVVTGDDVEVTTKAWIVEVGKISKERFLKAIEMSTSYNGFSDIFLPDSLLGSHKPTIKKEEPQIVEPQPQAVEPEEVKTFETTEVVAATEEEVTEEEPSEEPYVPTEKPANKKNAKVDELQALANAVEAPADSTPVTTKAQRKASEKELVATTDDEEVIPEQVDIAVQVTETLPVYNKVEILDDDNRVKASAEEVTELKNLFGEYGYDLEDPADQSRISTLLRYTFGEKYGKASNIPAEELLSFVDYYAAAGAETLQEAVKLALGRE